MRPTLCCYDAIKSIDANSFCKTGATQLRRVQQHQLLSECRSRATAILQSASDAVKNAEVSMNRLLDVPGARTLAPGSRRLTTKFAVRGDHLAVSPDGGKARSRCSMTRARAFGTQRPPGASSRIGRFARCRRQTLREASALYDFSRRFGRDHARAANTRRLAHQIVVSGPKGAENRVRWCADAAHTTDA